MQQEHNHNDKSGKATGTPVEPEKSIGPTSVIDVLGIKLNTEVMEIHLLADKLARLVQSLNEWGGQKVLQKKKAIVHHRFALPCV